MNVERAAPRGAVFLSYASQDAEAARRICETLRAAGVEVWFDQSELRGGDAWDQSIRRQIKDCALFVPIISTNTQSRHEGYFRLEWHLAEQRSHLIARGRPFIVPVSIDQTRDSEALVPDAFLAVQWMRLTGGEATPAFCERVKKLLSPEPFGDAQGRLGSGAGRNRLIPPSPRDQREDRGGVSDPAPQRKHKPVWPWIIAAVVALPVLYLIFKPRRSPEEIARLLAQVQTIAAQAEKASGANAPATAPAPPSGARQLVAKARALFDNRLDTTRDDGALAGDLLKQAEAKDATDAEVWAAEAELHEYYFLRGWDTSDARRESARVAAQRAIRLDPKSFEARLAQAFLLGDTGPEGVEKERQLRELRREQPSDQRLLRALAAVVDRLGRVDEAAALNDESARLPGGDPLALYNKSLNYWFAGRSAEAEAAMHAATAQKPFTGALLMSVWYAMVLHGDLTEARATLGRIAPAELLEDRGVFFAYELHWLARESDAALACLAAMPRDWINDNWYRGPKGRLIGDALQLAGRTEAAAVERRAALRLVDARLATDPTNGSLQYNRILLLAHLGERDEAARQLVVGLQTAGLDPAADRPMPAWVARTYVLLGRHAEAIQQIRRGLKQGRRAVDYTTALLRLDPSFDPLRSEPEFARVIAEAGAIEQAASTSGSSATPAPPSLTPSDRPKVDQKSVAVLAFENLSDDKSNEYFSDGISEELLNALAKVPGLRVAARTSAFYFKGRHATAQEIGQKLGMAHIVDGTVRKEGTAVRVVAHLSRTDTGEQIWTAAFDGTLDKPWALQEKIAGQIAQALQVKLGATVQAARSVNPEAYAFVLEGRYFWNQRADQPEAALAKAADAFQRALALDPDYAEAHAGLGDVWVTRGLYRSMDGRGTSAAGDYAQAKAEAQRALALNPTLAEPHVTLGYVAYCERQFADAEQHYARAYHWHAILLSAVGRVDESLRELDRSLRLDPLSSNTLWSLTVADLNRGRLAEALAASDRALELRPGLVPVHSDRALILLKLGRKDEAIAEARTVDRDLTVEPRWWADSGAIYVLREAGLEAEAADYAGRTLAVFSADDYRRAFVLAALGRFQEALQAMGRIPTIALTRVYWHPMWDPFRNDPRFLQLLVKLGCAEEYKAARATLARMTKQPNPTP